MGRTAVVVGGAAAIAGVAALTLLKPQPVAGGDPSPTGGGEAFTGAFTTLGTPASSGGGVIVDGVEYRNVQVRFDGQVSNFGAEDGSADLVLLLTSGSPTGPLLASAGPVAVNVAAGTSVDVSLAAAVSEDDPPGGVWARAVLYAPDTTTPLESPILSTELATIEPRVDVSMSGSFATEVPPVFPEGTVIIHYRPDGLRLATYTVLEVTGPNTRFVRLLTGEEGVSNPPNATFEFEMTVQALQDNIDQLIEFGGSVDISEPPPAFAVRVAFDGELVNGGNVGLTLDRVGLGVFSGDVGSTAVVLGLADLGAVALPAGESVPLALVADVPTDAPSGPVWARAFAVLNTAGVVANVDSGALGSI